MLKPSTDDRAKGTFHELKGAIKEKTGHIIKSPDLEAEGNAEKNAGKVQNWVGRVKKTAGK